MAMHLPWVQVDTDVLDRTAGDLATLLDVDPGIVFLGVVRMWRWAVERTATAEKPPDGIIRGPAAARLIENAAGWKGAAGAFLDACRTAGIDLVEALATPDVGYRVRGADRYVALWGKNNPDAYRRWKEGRASSAPPTSAPEPAPERPRAETGPEPERNRSETGPEPAPQTQKQTQKPPSEAGPPRAGVRAQDRPPDEDMADKWLAFQRAECAAAGLVSDAPSPRKVRRWHAAVVTELIQERHLADSERVADALLREGWRAYQENTRRKRAPWRWWRDQWPEWVARVAPMAPVAQLPLSVADAPRPEPTPAERAWTDVLAKMLEDGNPFATRWLGALRPELDGDVLRLQSPDRFHREWVEENYRDLLARYLERFELCCAEGVPEAAAA
jgi:hypothetical protein